MYNVNGWYPNYGCSRYQVKDGDVVEWRYTCDLGFFSAFHYADANFIAVPHRFCRLRVLHK